MVKIGEKAKEFTLKDKDGRSHALKEIKSEYTVLYFYPKDNTPGCTIEANNFNDKLAQFSKLGAKIIGISGGDEKSKTSFCKKYDLKITLLSDPDFSVCKTYGCYGKKQFMGRTYNGIFRNTFLLDKDKKILKIYEKVSVKEHADEILKDIKEGVGDD
jgi:thioredoxin-dependent peroxiredoxin